jgi:hypothetical protein
MAAQDSVFFDQVGHDVLRKDHASSTAQESIPPTRSGSGNPRPSNETLRGRRGAGNAALRDVLKREQTWLSQAERTVAEVRGWREREARQFWPSVARRWALALVFALASAWMAGADYSYVAKPYADELRVLRARVAVTESIEDWVTTMTPAERRQFDMLMKRTAAAAKR